jgi:hypothetical protein
MMQLSLWIDYGLEQELANLIYEYSRQPAYMATESVLASWFPGVDIAESLLRLCLSGDVGVSVVNRGRFALYHFNEVVNG